ncbi:MAG: RDD family protein [Pseudomonadota bacterium]
MAGSVRAEPVGRIREITSPEGVPIPFRVAGLPVRFGAQLLDLVLTMLFLGALVLCCVLIFGFAPWQMSLFVLGFFVCRIPYYIFTELIWNGATLGKRMLGVRVVSQTGGTLSVHSVVARNLMKEAEVFLPLGLIFVAAEGDGLQSALAGMWCLICLAIPMFSKTRQRLGDMIAGTIVIHQPDAVLLPDAARLGDATQSGRFAFSDDQLEHYGAYELQTLEGVLQRLSLRRQRRRRKMRDPDLEGVVNAIRNKIGYGDPVPSVDHEAFLADFYAAQRKHLETRQLFGDRRIDKYHVRDGTQ